MVLLFEGRKPLSGSAFATLKGAGGYPPCIKSSVHNPTPTSSYFAWLDQTYFLALHHRFTHAYSVCSS